MARSTRPRPLRATAAAFAIAAASFTTVACGSDTVDDDVQQRVEDGVEDAENEVEDATDGEDDDG
jgi:hypothetical protein